MAGVPLLGGQRIAAAHLEITIDGGGAVTVAYARSDGFDESAGILAAGAVTAENSVNFELTLSREVAEGDAAFIATGEGLTDPGPPIDFQPLNVGIIHPGVMAPPPNRLNTLTVIANPMNLPPGTFSVYVVAFRIT